MTKQTEVAVKRDYKSRMFAMIYGELLAACKTLGDYAEYVHRVRENRKKMSVEQAVDKAIMDCIHDNVLKEFLEKNRAEARTVSIYEYDEEEHMRMEREDSYADGFSDGVSSGISRGKVLIAISTIRKALVLNMTTDQIKSIYSDVPLDVEEIIRLLGKYPEASEEELLEKLSEVNGE